VYFNMPPIGAFYDFRCAIGYVFITHKNPKNSAAGLLSVFALNGLYGLTLGPIECVWAGLHLLCFKSLLEPLLAGYGFVSHAIFSKRDFSFLRSFLVGGIIVVFVMALIAFSYGIVPCRCSSAMFVFTDVRD